ncbi:composite domain of metallo-dependent hydrolase [Xylaria scruposa]|nr:composite domain of metallo-dependent hydrolase [Xylaria scruposa]
MAASIANGQAHANGQRNGVTPNVNAVKNMPFYKPTPPDITMSNLHEGDKHMILFRNVNIFDSTGADPYPGDVLIEGQRIKSVGKFDFCPDSDTLVIDGHGTKTLMSGLVDAHTHLSWCNASTMQGLTSLPLEEHVLHTARFAKMYLDCGYTMCFGAASAHPRMDISIKNGISSGLIPGPRTLANCQEIATTGGAIVPSISRFADGADEVRKVVREFISLGADNIKLNMTGDYAHPTMGAEETYVTLAETRAAVEEAHNRGKRICSHARSAASVTMSCLTGMDVIYHGSYVDAEGLEMLEILKDRVFVAPAINFLVSTCDGDGASFGLTAEMAKKRGMGDELEKACAAMNELRRRGVRVLPGGDYGFAWVPHGTYARDLAHFVNLFGYTPKEALIAATAMGGELMGHPQELGKVQPGYYGDVILVDGNPLDNVELFQDTANLHAIVINGHVHKNVTGPGQVSKLT